MFEGKKDISHNYTWQDGHMQFEKLLAPPFHSFYVHTALTDLQGRCTRKGKLLLPKSAPTFTQGEGRLALKHQKSQPIDDQLPNPFVQIIGLDDTEGNLIPQMRPKFRQVNQLLRILEKAIPQYEGRIVHILDCGSGSAWPTFSAYHYLHNNLQMPVQLKGIDCYEEVNEKSKRIWSSSGRI